MREVSDLVKLKEASQLVKPKMRRKPALARRVVIISKLVVLIRRFPGTLARKRVRGRKG